MNHNQVSICPKPSFRPTPTSTGLDLAFTQSPQLMAIVWPADWLLWGSILEMFVKLAEQPSLYPNLRSHWMDGRSTAETRGLTWRMFAISSSQLTSWCMTLGIFAKERPRGETDRAKKPISNCEKRTYSNKKTATNTNKNKKTLQIPDGWCKAPIRTMTSYSTKPRQFAKRESMYRVWSGKQLQENSPYKFKPAH